MSKLGQAYCAVCQQLVDRQDAVEVASNTYCCPPHVEAWNELRAECEREELELNKEATAKKRLEEYICDRYGIKRLTALMRRQINRYKKEDGMTYQGMYLTMYYCFTVSEPPAVPLLEAGVAIIPYYYDAAKQFFQRKREIQQQISQLDVSTMAQARVVNIEEEAQAPVRYKGCMIDIETLGGGDEE